MTKLRNPKYSSSCILSISVCLCVFLSTCLSVFLAVDPCLSLSLSLSVSLSSGNVAIIHITFRKHCQTHWTVTGVLQINPLLIPSQCAMLTTDPTFAIVTGSIELLDKGICNRPHHFIILCLHLKVHATGQNVADVYDEGTLLGVFIGNLDSSIL